mmetsp:Transcript_169079/g.543387  ORF Transcript_169079/g.543387 Transcript_169079/m.543387 type:complete len:213 (+) Transcript_169079:143-781(+)
MRACKNERRVSLCTSAHSHTSVAGYGVLHQELVGKLMWVFACIMPNPLRFITRRLPGQRPGHNSASSFAAASKAGIICFLRDKTPGSTTVPSLPTLTFHALSTSFVAEAEAEMKVAASFKMSTTKKMTSSSFSFSTSFFCASTSAACLAKGAAGFVVSSTEIRNFLPPILKIFVSIITSSSALRWSICALASSMASACLWRSKPAISASSCA